MSSYSYLFKYIIIGDTGVGKYSFIKENHVYYLSLLTIGF